MPGKKLPPEKLKSLKEAIKIQLDENPKITANQLHTVINRDPYFGREISMGMVQNHLSNLRKGQKPQKRRGKETNNVTEEVDTGRSRRTRLSIDKRVKAVHDASKDTERARLAYEKAMETLLSNEAELRDALRRALGTRADNLFTRANTTERAESVPLETESEEEV